MPCTPSCPKDELALRVARRSRLRLQQRCDGGRELIVVTDDGSTTLRASTEANWSRQVVCIWRVQRVEVPCRPASMRHVLAEPVANDLLLVPEMGDARIGHTIAIPAVATVAVQHVEPDGVHAQVGVGSLAENVLLDPTGPLSTLRSSG